MSCVKTAVTSKGKHELCLCCPISDYEKPPMPSTDTIMLTSGDKAISLPSRLPTPVVTKMDTPFQTEAGLCFVSQLSMYTLLMSSKRISTCAKRLAGNPVHNPSGTWTTPVDSSRQIITFLLRLLPRPTLINDHGCGGTLARW
jgi:hypothetical protein